MIECKRSISVFASKDGHGSSLSAKYHERIVKQFKNQI